MIAYNWPAAGMEKWYHRDSFMRQLRKSLNYQTNLSDADKQDIYEFDQLLGANFMNFFFIYLMLSLYFI